MRRFTVALFVYAAMAQPGRIPGWFLSGMNRVQFRSVVDRETMHGGGASARLECLAKRCDAFGTLMQTIKADEFVGQRIRLSAWVKAVDAGRPRLWMRVDDDSGATIAFDNMDHRAKSGSFDWQLQQVVLNVGKNAALINFGFMVEDRGLAWIDDVSLEVVDRKAKDTNRGGANGASQGNPAEIRKRWERAPERPVNLDFEQQ